MNLRADRPFSVSSNGDSRWFLSGLAVLVGGVGVYFLWQWRLGPSASSLATGRLPMAPSTALTLVVLSAAAAAYPYCAVRKLFRIAAFIGAVLAGLGALLVLARDFGGLAFNWERWLVETPFAVDGIPAGRMSPFTAALVVLASFGFAALSTPVAARPVMQHLALGALVCATCFSAISTMAYAAGAPLFYDLGYVPIASSTAVAFTVLCGVLAAEAGGLAFLNRLLRDVQGQLLVGFSTIILLLMLLAVTAYIGLVGARHAQETLVRQNLANLYEVVQFRTNLFAQRLAVLMVFEAAPDQRPRWLQEVNDRTRADQQIIAHVGVRLAVDPDTSRQFAQLAATWAEFVSTRDTILWLVESDRIDEAKALYWGVQATRQARLEDIAHVLEVHETTTAQAIVAQAEDRGQFFLALFSTLGTSSIVGAVGLALAMRAVMRRYVVGRGEAENALRKAGTYNRTLIEASLDPLVTIGPDGKITDVNAATEHATGRTRAELVGADFSDYFTDPAEARTGYQRVFRDAFVRDYPLELRHADGRTISVLYNATVYRDENGAVAGVFAAARDVTAQRRAEAELRRVNRALLTISGCHQALVRANDEAELMQEICRCVVASGGYRFAWVGIALDDVEKSVRPVASFGFEDGYLAIAHLSWADNERGHGPTGSAIRTGMPVVCRDMTTDPKFAPWRENALKRGYRSSLVLPLLAEGHAFGALSIYAAETDAFNDDETRLLASLADDLAYGIRAMRTREERRRMSQELQQSELRLRSMIENARDYAILRLERDGMVSSWNTGAQKIFGYDPGEMIGRSIAVFYTPEDAAAGKSDLELAAAARTGRCEDEHWLLRKDGSRFWADVILTALHDTTGALTGFVKITRDLTERKAADDRIKSQAEELRRSNKDLENFAYVASHDLQEPLRTVSSFSQLLARRYRGRLDTDADDFIGFIVGGAARMQTLINDLLSFSRVGTRGKPFTPVNCETVLAAALANLGATIDDSHAAITHDPLPTVTADDLQLVQVFQNLIGNAIKFRAHDTVPKIHIGAAREPDAWHFTVRDNGIGIEPQYFERIFIIFQRLHGRDEYPGTGIGLALCRKIVERHGGRIWVESAPDAGSTFHFTLPEQPTP